VYTYYINLHCYLHDRVIIAVLRVTESGVIWKDVMISSEDISVDFSAVEELFASKTIQPKDIETKKPTEVFGHFYLLAKQ